MIEHAVDVFRALSDATRLRILHLLRSGDLCVGDLVSALDVPQPTASRHLTHLRNAGLIKSQKKSYWTFYSLAPATTELHRRVLECLDVDTVGRAKDVKRLAAVRRDGGCCSRLTDLSKKAE